MDEIRGLTHRAVHAFATGIAEFEGDERNLNGLLSDVLARYIHDAKISMKELSNNILGDMLASPKETLVLTPSLTLVAPLQEMLDAIPVPGLADLFSLEGLTEEVVERVFGDGVGTLVSASYGKVERAFDEEAVKLAGSLA